MITEIDIVSLNILKQREALYQLNKHFDLSRTDLEVLTFSQRQMFFTLYDLQRFYSHTNVQQIRRSLKRLTEIKALQVISRGIKNKPTNYVVSRTGKQVFKNYAALILGGTVN